MPLYSNIYIHYLQRYYSCISEIFINFRFCPAWRILKTLNAQCVHRWKTQAFTRVGLEPTTSCFLEVSNIHYQVFSIYGIFQQSIRPTCAAITDTGRRLHFFNEYFLQFFTLTIAHSDSGQFLLPKLPSEPAMGILITWKIIKNFMQYLTTLAIFQLLSLKLFSPKWCINVPKNDSTGWLITFALGNLQRKIDSELYRLMKTKVWFKVEWVREWHFKKLTPSNQAGLEHVARCIFRKHLHCAHVHVPGFHSHPHHRGQSQVVE